MRERKSGAPPRKIRKLLFYAIMIGFVVFGLTKVLDATKNLGDQVGDQRVEIQGAKSTTDINREFSFPLRDDKGEQVSQLKFGIQTAELRDEIVVKGQRANAVKGRTFLILNLKISNDFGQSIEINTKNYVRMTRNNNEYEKLAPDIHNDPVEVQADSTKLTRVGFPINDSDSDLKLHIGEIGGEKQIIDLKF